MALTTCASSIPRRYFQKIFVNENAQTSIKISRKFVPCCLIKNIPALVRIIAWRQPSENPLSQPMMAQFIDTYMRHSASMS